jgi:predicted XRE-type DNA-binding protein
MRKVKPVIARDAAELAKGIGMSPADANRWEIRSQLVSKIIAVVSAGDLTHLEVAKLVKTSRSRITSILNRNIDDVSTDLLLRILEALGYRVMVTISRQRLVA